MTHTKKDAEYCLWYFRKHISQDAVLIGSFGRGAKESKKDIDIHIPNHSHTDNALMNKIKNLIDAKDVESTDWDGWFFHGTIFGNVDVFFDISEFDY